MRRLCLALVLSTLATMAPARAQELRIGVQTETSSLDPHFALVGANQAVALHVFDPLVASDTAMRPAAGLTTLSSPASGVWDVHIRNGARFSDGTPVTAEALRFSLDRMPRVPNSPAPFVRLAAATASMEVVDPRTLRIHARAPGPDVELNGMTAYVVRPVPATTAEFNAGPAAIGSGPWAVVSWQPGAPLVLDRNPLFWGTRPDFARATLVPIASDAARVAALLSGDVDLIDRVPQADLPRLRANPAFAVTASPSARVIYLALDQAGDSSPFVTGKDGKPLPHNPLRDPLVRRALSVAINRDALVERVLGGGGHPTGQLAVPGQVGYDPALKPPPFDPAAAKALLAEAGYPGGFRLTLHSPANRYVEDAKTVQAVAQFWTRLGVETAVEVMPANVFFARAGRREFSAFLIGFGHSTGDAGPGLAQVLQTYDGQGAGGLNRGRFSDPRFDALMRQVAAVSDPAERDRLLRQAQELALGEDTAVIPLHVPDNVWAHKAGITYEGGLEESTLAQRVHLK